MESQEGFFLCLLDKCAHNFILCVLIHALGATSVVQTEKKDVFMTIKKNANGLCHSFICACFFFCSSRLLLVGILICAWLYLSESGIFFSVASL